MVALAGDDTRLRALAAGVESSSGHPLARVIVSRADAAGTAIASVTDARAYPGRGASAEIEGMTRIVASSGYAESLGFKTGKAP